MKKKIVSSLLTLALILGGYASFTNTADAGSPPYNPPIEAHLTVKWGNVNGAPVHTNRISFDGKMYMAGGDVTLTDVINFENHDDAKDRITSKQNPVSWTSWIFNHFDGVKVKVVADPSADVTIATDAGSITVPYHTLLTAERNTALKFGDGREIVIKTNEIITDPFYVYALWGGPLDIPAADADQAEAVRRDMETFAETLRVSPQSADVPDVLISDIAPRPIGADFSGKLGVANGARMSFVEPILFEPGHGDMITDQGENYVAWDSYLFGHFDGVFMKAQLDQRRPIDDKIGIKFGEAEWSKRYSLASLYVNGILWDRVEHNGETFLVALIATDEPFCALHGDDSTTCQTPTPQPIPQPTPQPQPESVIDEESLSSTTTSSARLVKNAAVFLRR